jgi:hypothetical protein
LLPILEIITTNSSAAKWFNLLTDIEKRNLTPIFNQVLITTAQYNNYFQGYEVYITGSSLNIVERNYNDIDVMVVIPEVTISKFKQDLLSGLMGSFKSKNIDQINKWTSDPRIQLLNMNELINSMSDSLEYSSAIKEQDKEYLLNRFGSMNEVQRLMMDPESELSAIQMRLESMVEEEKNKNPVEPDDQGYQFGSLVECFLRDVTSSLESQTQDGKPKFQVQLYKSFSEGYGRTAGENNCHIFPMAQCVPVHLFLTTDVDYKKAMEKKESFMLEYYSEHERMKPIKIY